MASTECQACRDDVCDAVWMPALKAGYDEERDDHDSLRDDRCPASVSTTWRSSPSLRADRVHLVIKARTRQGASAAGRPLASTSLAESPNALSAKAAPLLGSGAKSA